MGVDVAIVGAGPAGCFTGKLLAESGFSVAIAEEHPQVGYPMCCTGIVGLGGLRELRIKPDRWVLNELRGATIYPPSDPPVTLGRNRREAVVIDRGAFDRELAEEACATGATLLMGTRCVGVRLDKRVILKLRGFGGEKELEARLLVGADGVNSIVARKAGLLKKPSHVHCVQAEMIAEGVETNMAEIYLGREFALGFFAWLVPAGELSRVGLGTLGNSAARGFFKFIRKHPIVSKKLRRCKTLHLSGGLIPLPETRGLYTDRVMLVGDAAAQVKPLTGGGLYIGLSCARLAARVAEKALEDEPMTAALRAYERAVTEKFGLEFKLGMLVRRVYERLSNNDLNSLLNSLALEGVRKPVLKYADFDHHAKTIGALVKSPSFLRSLGAKGLLKLLRPLI